MLEPSGDLLLSGGNDGALLHLGDKLEEKWRIQFGHKGDVTLKEYKDKIDVELDISHKLAKGVRAAKFNAE